MITDILALWPAVLLVLLGWSARDALCRYREYQQNRKHQQWRPAHVHRRVPWFRSRRQKARR